MPPSPSAPASLCLLAFVGVRVCFTLEGVLSPRSEVPAAIAAKLGTDRTRPDLLFPASVAEGVLSPPPGPGAGVSSRSILTRRDWGHDKATTLQDRSAPIRKSSERCLQHRQRQSVTSFASRPGRVRLGQSWESGLPLSDCGLSLHLIHEPVVQ
eukprot:1612161-Rhodomonas_salina.1